MKNEYRRIVDAGYRNGNLGCHRGNPVSNGIGKTFRNGLAGRKRLHFVKRVVHGIRVVTIGIQRQVSIDTGQGSAYAAGGPITAHCSGTNAAHNKHIAIDCIRVDIISEYVAGAWTTVFIGRNGIGIGYRRVIYRQHGDYQSVCHTGRTGNAVGAGRGNRQRHAAVVIGGRQDFKAGELSARKGNAARTDRERVTRRVGQC